VITRYIVWSLDDLPYDVGQGHEPGYWKQVRVEYDTDESGFNILSELVAEYNMDTGQIR